MHSFSRVQLLYMETNTSVVQIQILISTGICMVAWRKKLDKQRGLHKSVSLNWLQIKITSKSTVFFGRGLLVYTV